MRGEADIIASGQTTMVDVVLDGSFLGKADT
jgi:hypothetical protein